jgi:hypothetical protein
MPELKHHFRLGRMNKDLDERLVNNGEYRDALNIEIASSEGSDVGSVQNILGNKIENVNTYNSDTKVYTYWASSFGLSNAKCVGSVRDTENEKIYWFLTSDSADCIVEFNQINKEISPILVDTQNILNFSSDNFITGVNILEGLLFWTDNVHEPKKINISKFKKATNNTFTHTQINGGNFIEDHITVIKKAPINAPTLTMSSSKRSGIVESSTSYNFTLPSSGGSPMPTTTPAFTLTFNPAPNFIVGDTIILSASEDDANFEDEIEVRIKIESVLSNVNFSVVLQSVSSLVPSQRIVYKAVLEQEEPLFEFKFPRFAYRYKYEDGEYSSFSPFSEIAFLPGKFDYNPKKGYNLGMTNNVRSLTIENFKPSDIPYDVKEVDLLYKESNSTNVYSVKTFDSEDAEWTSNSFNIESEIIYATLPSDQLLRPWDNVPLKAKAQEMIGNRLIYGNYTQNYDLTDYNNNIVKPKFDVIIEQPSTKSVVVKSPSKSIKSLRTYQLGIVYKDKYGRETPVLTDNSGSKKIGKKSADNYNNIKVKLTNPTHPSWATHFKYFIKEPSNEYYNLAMDRWYNAEDDNIWLSFPSSERNKIQEDRFIILKKRHDSDVFVQDEAKYKVIAISNEAPDFLKETKKGKGIMDTTFLTNGFPQKDGTFVDIDATEFESETFGVGEGQNPEIISMQDLYIRFKAGNNASKYYEVVSFSKLSSPDRYRITIDKTFKEDISFVGTSSSPVSGLSIEIAQQVIENKPEFTGRFFVKVYKDQVLQDNILSKTDQQTSYGIVSKEKIFLIKNKSASKSFWRDSNKGGGDVKSGWFIDNNNNYYNSGHGGGSLDPANRRDGKLLGATNSGYGIEAGKKTISISYHWFGGKDRNAWPSVWQNFPSDEEDQQFIDFVKSLENDGMKFRLTDDPTNTVYEVKKHLRTHIFAYDQARVKRGKFASMRVIRWTLAIDKPIRWSPETNVNGIENKANGTGFEFLTPYNDDAEFTTDNPAIWETEPLEDIGLDLYYEASKAYPINQHGDAHTLDWSNCYSFGNGVESNRIRDDFNAVQIDKGPKVSTILAEQYKQEVKKTGLIFSGIFNSTSGINRTNQFLIAEPITKDLNPYYGSIQKLYSRTRDGDLITLCEDKSLKILADKDALYNADGNANLTSVNRVLGQAIPYVGEFGISKNPESFVQYGFRSYWADKNRGVVLRLSNDGLEEISNKGMSDFFSDNLAVATSVVGSYDNDKSVYHITLNNKTISYKENVKGWTTRCSFIQENGLSLNNKFYTFKDGNMWVHYSNDLRNNFYGVQYNSTIKLLINDAPSSIKSFTALNYEGSQAVQYTYDIDPNDGETDSQVKLKNGWFVNSITTDQQTGSIKEFKNKEGKWFNYIKGEATTLSNLDTKEFSVQGIGNPSVVGDITPQYVITVSDTGDEDIQP